MSAGESGYLRCLQRGSAHVLRCALAFDFRADPATYDIRDQFMFGPAFLVAPVTRPMYYAAGSRPLTDVDKRRAVYLPTGCDWYDFWTGARLVGGQTVLADAPLGILPLYVRAGSIVPLGPRRQHVDELPDAIVELHIYPGRDGSFQLYEDEGDSYNYERGAFSTIRMTWQDAARRLVLDARMGRYPGMPERREFLVLLHGAKQPERMQTRLVAYEGNPNPDRPEPNGSRKGAKNAKKTLCAFAALREIRARCTRI